MKYVKFLVNTAYRGPRKEGEVISVPDDYASRWVKNGIAEYVSGHAEYVSCQVQEPAQEPVDDHEEGSKEFETPDIQNMSTKELYALCKEKGIDAEAKKSKEYYLEKLGSVEE